METLEPQCVPEINFNDLSQWKTLKEISEVNPNFKVSTLRWLIRSIDFNGLDAVAKKVGKQWMFHQQAFSHWIATK